MPDTKERLTTEDLVPCPCGEEPYPDGALDVAADSRGTFAHCDECSRVGPRSTEPDEWPQPGSYSEAVKLWNEAVEDDKQLKRY